MNKRTENIVRAIGLTILTIVIVYLLIAGDISGFNNTYLNKP